MADHYWVQDHIASYLAGGLDAAERAELEAHAAACADCAAAVAAARQLDQELAALFTTVRPAADLEDRAIRRLRLQETSRTASPLRTKTIRFLLAAAAVLMLGITGAGMSYLVGEGGPMFAFGGDEAERQRASRTGLRRDLDPDHFEGRIRPSMPSITAMTAPPTGEDPPNEALILDHSGSMSAWELDPGYRAVTVPANIESAVHGFLQPGMRVDLLTAVRDGDNPQITKSQIFLQNVKVLAVNNQSDRPQENPTVPNPVSISLMVKPDELERLQLVSSRGQIGIGLRKPGDSITEETKGATSPFGDTSIIPGSVSPDGILPGALALPSGEVLVIGNAVTKDNVIRRQGREPKDGGENYYSYRDEGKPNAKPVPPTKTPDVLPIEGRSGSSRADAVVEKLEEKLPQSDLFNFEQKAPKDAPPKEEPAKPAAAEPPPPAAAERKIIRSGELEFEVDSFDSAIDRVEKIAAEEGGLVATINSDKLPNGKMKGQIILRVPPRNLDDLIKKLRALGELKRQRLGSQDVTKLYYDMDSRLKAARTMEKRLLDIIAKGNGTVKDLVEAEKELGVWRTRIEELEGEVRYYNNLVSLATLTIHLTEKDIRSAYAVVENRKVDLGIEVEDVEAAQRKAQDLITQAKARVTRSELRKGDAGSFQAILYFEATPENAGPLLDALKQLGTITRQEVDQSQKAEGGVDRPLDAKVTKADVQFQLSLFNLATAAAEQTIHVSLACADVEAAYKQILARADKTALRIQASTLDQTRADQATASLAFEVRTADADDLLNLVKQAGEVMRLQEVETQGGGQITKAKRGFRITFHSLATVKPREVITLSMVTTDVPKNYQFLQETVATAKGRTLNANLEERDGQNVTAVLYFDVRRGDEPAIMAALAKAGAIFARSVTRDTSDDALDTKVGYRVHLINQSALKPRETIVLGIEVQDVERTVSNLTGQVATVKGRVVSSGVSKNRAGETTAQLIYEVPMLELRKLAEEFKREGHVQVQDADRNPQVPENELSIGRLEVSLTSPRAIVEDGFAASMQNGLRWSARVLFYCVVFLVAGLIVTAPLWIGLGIWYLLRRRKKAEGVA